MHCRSSKPYSLFLLLSPLLIVIMIIRFYLPGSKPSAVSNILQHVDHPGAPGISQCSHNSAFSDNRFPSNGSVCCCRSNTNASTDTKAGFLTKKPLCCLLKDDNSSDVFFCAAASCEDRDGKHISEQDTDGNSCLEDLKSETHHVCNCSKLVYLFFSSCYTKFPFCF